MDSFVVSEDGRMLDLVAMARRGKEMIDRREYEEGVRLCESVLSIPNLSVYDRDWFTYNFCLCLQSVCFFTGDRIDEYFRISDWLLHRLNQSDCQLPKIEILKCQIHSDRASLLFHLDRYDECIFEATMAIQINPMNKWSIFARIKTCSAYALLSQYSEMKSDLDELREVQKLGLAKGWERQIEELSASYHSEFGVEGGKRRDYHELLAEGLASIQSVSTVYNPTSSIDWNVNSLLYHLKFDLDHVSKFLGRTREINKHSIPEVCSCRRTADALVHLVFAVPDKRKVFPKIMPNEPSRVAVLRISDTMKNPLVLSHEQRQRIIIIKEEEITFPNILDQTEDFWPSEGFIIAYHLILEECELCSPCLFRWIISDGIVLHADRQQITSCSELLSDIEFLPSLFGGGKPLVSDSRWFEQVDVCRRLCGLLLGGLESFYSSVDRLIFVPDIHLFRVSFGCLLCPDGKYLIESHTVSVSSSIRLVRELQEQKLRSMFRREEESRRMQIGALVCGDVVSTCGHVDSATSVAGVVDCLTSLQPDGDAESGDIVVLREHQFIPSQLEDCCRLLHPQIVHIVAHGSAVDFVDENADILDEFRIHGEMDSSDGTVVSAREVAWNYDLSGTDLVFLNSCSVGYGKLQKSGVLGFNHAIFQAGCPSVISSLWQIEPTLSLRMSSSFYRMYLSRTLDKAESLRFAIVDLLARHQFATVGDMIVRLRSSPALWGSYQLFGHPL